MTIIPDLSDLVLEQVSMTNEVTITVRATSPAAHARVVGSSLNGYKAVTRAPYAICQPVDVQFIW